MNRGGDGNTGKWVMFAIAGVVKPFDDVGARELRIARLVLALIDNTAFGWNMANVELPGPVQSCRTHGSLGPA